MATGFGGSAFLRKNDNKIFRKLERTGDRDEIVGLKGSAADETTVNVLLCEEFFRVGRFAASAVQNGRVLGHLGTEPIDQHLSDAGVDLLGLVGSSCLAGSDGLDRLVSDDDLRHIGGRELGQHILDLLRHDFEMLPGFPLIQVLPDTQDHTEAFRQREFHFLDQLFVGFTVVFSPLGMSQDRPLATD